ncbi:MAG TPA: adenylate/guanylate cyclase domain-containing protein [Reyranella sp.]|jgi:adenylate cyclase|nr:adenylate/guanylate cyclase domain-containing protein [Reyranella sp.]
MTEQRRLAAILVADVVGYSKLVGEDETGTLERLQSLRRDVIEPTIAKHAGRLFKTTGDGLLVEFASAVQAVGCAKAIQDANDNGGLPLRIGIHVGDVVVQGDDLMGDGVNIAARIEGVAESGGIAISNAVYEQVRDKFDLAFEDRGEVALRNLTRPVRLFSVGGAKRTAAATASALALPDKPSIAVLPFQNMSGDPDQEYFADGVVEEITTVLGRLKSLFVIARNSSFTYKGKAVDVKQVGRELGVRYVLEGSVRRSGNRVRITVQLLDAGSGSHLWTDRFDGTLDDIFELHDQIATNVAGAVEPTLREAEIDLSLRKPTTSLNAYDLYMRAQAAFRTAAQDSLRTSMELTGRAIELDPHFGRALALRALCLMHLHSDDGADSGSAETLRLAQAALAANDDWEALSLGAMVIALMGGEIDTALAASQRALALNPNGFWALMHNGWVQCAAGNPAAAIEPFTRALRLSPRDPLLGYCELGLANAYRDVGQPAQALHWGRRATLSLPLLAGGYRAVIVALVDLGRIDEAREAVGQLLKTLPTERLRPELVYRQNRNRETADAWITALRQAGLAE